MHSITADQLPTLIQGGMGMGISHWHLARSVAQAGQLGVISGTAIDTILIRRLQQGDPQGYMREAMRAYPNQSFAQEIYDEYFIADGKPDDASFKAAPLPQVHMHSKRAQLIVLANFCETYLAKQGHQNPIGINLLDKIAIPNLASLFGAMLAGVDVVCMGAGIPHWVPEVLERLSKWESAEIQIPTTKDGVHASITQTINPDDFGVPQQDLKCPLFLAIISSDIIGKSLLRRTNERIDGFVVENYTAGGHNAPPRKKDAQSIDDYSEKDLPNIDRIKALGLPFWLAGSCANVNQYQAAIEAGARGVQIGTPFAFCADSGMDQQVRNDAIEAIRNNSVELTTDFKASPTGYPFKVLDIYKNIQRNSPCNERTCDLGYLRSVVESEDGSLSYRCPAEPMSRYAKKGGEDQISEDKICLCNGLMATCGVPQVRNGRPEAPLITAGDSLDEVSELVRIHEHYNARDVIDYVLAPVSS